VSSPIPQLPAVALNDEQSAALNALMQFINDPDPESYFFLLKGFAGTGKTFLMRQVLARSKGSRTKFAFTAPTNKAAKVLRGVTGKACTIYSLLGLRIGANGEVKELVTSEKRPEDLEDLDVVFVDEGSMISSVLFDIIVQEANANRLKFVVMADEAQLPPVKEPVSRVFTQPDWYGSSLSKVMRHDNQILKLATHLRESVFKAATNLVIANDHTEDEGVWKLSIRDFRQRIYSLAESGGFADSNGNKVIAWRNARVGEYNNLIRTAIYGAEAIPGYYLPGDRIIAAAPCMRGDEPLLTTDSEAFVESVQQCKHPLEGHYSTLELKCKTEDGLSIRLWVPDPQGLAEWVKDCDDLAHKAKREPKLWRKFWELKEIFHEIKYAYAITAHRAQGSTYHTVYVDYQDILYNRNRKEAIQCLYVACSRPTTRLFLA
jgi:ATP-dependent exoDNAse (exonuclease V) alpha subunit